MVEGKQVIAANADGLGNRIKCMISAVARDPDAKVFWPRNNSINCEFSALFNDESRLIDELPSDAEVITSWRLTGYPLDLLPFGFATYGDHSREESRTIDFEYNRIPFEVKGILQPHFDAINPSVAVESQVLSTSKKFSSKTVSVHVRSWADSSARAYKFSISEYYRIMDKFENHDFFIACDSSMVIEKFNKRYPGRIITYEPTSEEKIDGSQYLHAFADMLLLSKNSWLIASYGSTFSEVAWWLGGASAKVIVAPLRKYTGKIDDVNHVYLLVYKILKRVKNWVG